MTRIVIGLVLGCAVWAAPVGAVVVTGTFTGIVTQSINADSVFGSATSIEGMSASGTFSYDTASLPGLYPLPSTTAATWIDNGGNIQMNQTVNGVTVHFGGTSYEQLSLFHGLPIFGGNPLDYQFFGLNSDDDSNSLPTSGGFYDHHGTIGAHASDDSVAIVGDPFNPAVAFSVVPPYGYASGRWDDVANCGTGPLCRSWAIGITSISVTNTGVPAPGAAAVLCALVGLAAARAGANLRRGPTDAIV